ncbi:hypothetical protein BBJ28_00026875, partial [Nothophytophthora sp. Chile5]
MTHPRASFYSLLGFILLIAQHQVAVATLMRYDWNVTPYHAVYDGVSVDAYGINDGPGYEAVIEVTLGDEVEVHLTNLLDNATCLHWHGLKELGTQDMDGVSGLTQCYLETNGTAVYHFTPDKAGTFWWHSHDGTQYIFGLCGPLIVHKRAGELQPWEEDIAAEYTVELSDWYHAIPSTPPIWDTVLINYKGRYNCSAAEASGLACSTEQEPSRFQFAPGKKYLLRLINEGGLASFLFSIDNHEFRVVAANGVSMEPSERMNTLFINVGQRYDIIVEAQESSAIFYDQDDQALTLGSFWMRATAQYGLPWTGRSVDEVPEGFNAEALAIIDYEGTEATNPTTASWTTIATVHEFDFTPVNSTRLPEIPDDRVVLAFNMSSEPKGYFSINGGAYNNFVAPDEPPLYTIASGETTASLPASANAYQMDFGKHVEVVLVNDMNEQHPFHMHSHAPWVVGSGTATREAVNSGNLTALKLDGPTSRDTYTVPPCDVDANDDCVNVGYLVLRFNADNPG